MKKKYLIFLIIILIFISPLLFISKISDAGKLPKYQQSLWSKSFTVFMEMPDVVKSSLLIFSGKRNFSNLFNDYNVKFLPNTQYLKLNYTKKKIDFPKNSRFSFYIEEYKNNILIITKDGQIYKSDLGEVEKDNKNLITTNLSYENLFSASQKNLKILDSLVIDNKIYLTKTILENNCRKLSIIYSEINDVLKFQTFKEFNECASIGFGAGRIQQYTLNSQDGIIISTSDADNDDPGSKAQDDNSIYGKILFVNLANAEHEIISKGHRNAQGLFVKNNIILSTEHGPRGGDEINMILYKKNYGWPIASYGYSYEKKNLVYKKSHEDNFFEEPLFVFLPSIGISEIIILPNSFDERWKNSALVSSLNGRSIYRVKFQNESFNKVLYTEKIFIGERIRDIKYFEKINSIIIALERTGSIGVLRKDN